jgi:hypothetical protein
MGLRFYDSQIFLVQVFQRLTGLADVGAEPVMMLRPQNWSEPGQQRYLLLSAQEFPGGLLIEVAIGYLGYVS